MYCGYYNSSWYVYFGSSRTSTFSYGSTSTLTVGDTVDSSTTWGTFYNYNGLIADTVGDKIYLAYKNVDGTDTIYGYVELKVIDTTNGAGIIAVVGYAYSDTANTAITIVDLESVPEPATFGVIGGVLALGAAGMYRRRKTA